MAPENLKKNILFYFPNGNRGLGYYNVVPLNPPKAGVSKC